jgi:hypothetical protein
MRYVLKLVCAGGLIMLLAPAPAHADGYVSPFVGVNFANNSGNGRANFGFDAGWMGARIAGAEFDFGYAPNFFASGDFGDNHALTAMGNLIVGVPVERYGAGIRPYGTIGIGLVRTVTSGGLLARQPTANNDLGVNGGLGVMGFFSPHAGIRGEVRYFHNLNENSQETVQFGTFHFWRATLGVVLR